MSATIPWEGWYHCIGGTYGSWLLGDDRGSRTRHHRQHIEGDYRNPPPEGKYDYLRRRSEEAMKRPPVIFSVEAREPACRIMGEALLFYGAEVVDLCVSAYHRHALVKFDGCKVTLPRQSPRTPVRGSRPVSAYEINPVPRLVLGKVRSWTTRQLKAGGFFEDVAGGLWAKRPKIQPIESRDHWQYVGGRYIPDHVAEGAAVWSMLREDPRTEDPRMKDPPPGGGGL
ncbi:MAG: hypothetical protein ACYC26_09370 [Phycisphaerales bacterium]